MRPAPSHLVVALLATAAAVCTAPVSTAPVSAAPVSAAPAAPVSRTAERHTLHYIANRHGSTRPAALGFDLFDTGPHLTDLPRGTKALVWLGEKVPTMPTSAWKHTVRRLAAKPRVFGYYLADEPHDPASVAALRAKADFIARVSKGAQVSFITLSEIRDYRTFRPAASHVTLFGLDPYPKSVNGFVLSKVDRKVQAARSAGIPAGRIVPVYQAFGQGRTAERYYAMPTARQTRLLLARWRRLVPAPVFDYTYTWGHQRSARPTLVDRPTVQGVYQAWFAQQ